MTYDRTHDAARLGTAVLDDGDKSRERDTVAAEHALGQRIDRIRGALHQRPL
jgi:hypothetical protein